MMLRHCSIISKIKTVSECKWVSTCSGLLKDAGNDGHGKSDPASKLNALLLSIVKEEKVTPPETPKIQLPTPRAKQRLKKAEVKKNLGSQIVAAAKDVATGMEGDSKEVEAQLLQKLLYKDSPVKDEILKASTSNKSLSNLISQMDVEKEKHPETKEPINEELSRAAQVRSLLGPRTFKDRPISRKDQRVNIFGEKPLGIFDPKVSKEIDDVSLDTWAACENREKKLSVSQAPSNYFEQMINWTEKGVVWKFPIDNEQGLEHEKNVSFSSHVLLETHLEGWCPTAGPIRHFMELVCVGLSRNHWFSAAEKEEHILWYKDFFTERRSLIKEIGAGEIPEASETTSPST